MNCRTKDNFDLSIHIKILKSSKFSPGEKVFIQFLNDTCVISNILTLGYQHPNAFIVIEHKWGSIKPLIFNQKDNNNA